VGEVRDKQASTSRFLLRWSCTAFIVRFPFVIAENISSLVRKFACGKGGTGVACGLLTEVVCFCGTESELCASILPAIRDLLKSHHHWYNLTACQALEKVLSGFGSTIYSNVTAKSIGVDLSQQARRDKCQICHHTLNDIHNILVERMKHHVDSSLQQAFDDNLRLIRACERS